MVLKLLYSVINKGAARSGANDGAKGKQGQAQARHAPNTRLWLHGWSWEPDEEFDIECLVGKMVADGGEVPGREGTRIHPGGDPRW